MINITYAEYKTIGSTYSPNIRYSSNSSEANVNKYKEKNWQYTILGRDP